MSFVSWLWALEQFNFYISFLCSAMYYIALLLTVAKKRVCAPVAHKKVFVTAKLLFSPQLASDLWWGLPAPTFWDHENRRRTGGSLNQRFDHRWRCRGAIPLHQHNPPPGGSLSGSGTAVERSEFARTNFMYIWYILRLVYWLRDPIENGEN